MLRINRDSSFRPAEGYPCDGTLPGHPHRQRLHFVYRDTWVVSDAALVWSEGVVMLASESLIELDSSVIHFDWEVNAQDSSGLSEYLLRVGVESHYVGGALELFDRHIILGLLHSHAAGSEIGRAHV